MVQAKSFDEVMEWMKRCPALHEDGAEIEIRRLIGEVGAAPGAEIERCFAAGTYANRS